MNPTVLPADEVLSAIERLLRPYLWFTQLTWLPLMNLATLEGYVKPGEIAIDALEGYVVGQFDVPAVWAAWSASAQAAIRVVEEAGYLHTQHPEFRIEGDIEVELGTTVLRPKATLSLSLRPPERTKPTLA